MRYPSFFKRTLYTIRICVNVWHEFYGHRHYWNAWFHLCHLDLTFNHRLITFLFRAEHATIGLFNHEVWVPLRHFFEGKTSIILLVLRSNSWKSFNGIEAMLTCFWQLICVQCSFSLAAHLYVAFTFEVTNIASLTGHALSNGHLVLSINL